MKGNHRQNTAWAQQAFNRLKPSGQFVKFAIDENAQGLKAARCRINLPGSFGWHDAMDNGGQLAGAGNFSFLANTANGLGDTARCFFFAIFPEDTRQIGFVEFA